MHMVKILRGKFHIWYFHIDTVNMINVNDTVPTKIVSHYSNALLTDINFEGPMKAYHHIFPSNHIMSYGTLNNKLLN
jgi:hypothetical protein